MEEFGRFHSLVGLSRDEEEVLEVQYGASLFGVQYGLVGEQLGDPVRVKTVPGGPVFRERDWVVANYPARVTVVNLFERAADGSFRYGDLPEFREAVRRFESSGVPLGTRFEDSLPGAPRVSAPAD